MQMSSTYLEEKSVKELPRKKHIRTRTGCFTCRRRKKKCDETRPGCRNCHRIGAQCEGYPAIGRDQSSFGKYYDSDRCITPLYDKDNVYLDDGINTQPEFAMLSKCNQMNELTTTTITRQTEDKEFTSSEEYLNYVDSLTSSHHRNTYSHPTVHTPLPDLIDGVSSPLQRRLFHYFITHLARISCIFGSIPSECPFISVIAPIAVHNKFMMDTVLYLSATHMLSNIGKSRKNTSLYRQLGIERVKNYQKALKNASNNLSHWETALTDDNLLVISLLLFADMCYGETGGSGPGHVSGLYTLLVEREKRRLLPQDKDDDDDDDLSGTMTGLSRLSLRRETSTDPVDRYLYDIFHYCHTSLTITLSPKALKEYLPFKEQAVLRRAVIKRQTSRQASLDTSYPPILMADNNNKDNLEIGCVDDMQVPEFFNDINTMYFVKDEFKSCGKGQVIVDEKSAAPTSNRQMVEALRGIASGIFDIIEEICALEALIDENDDCESEGHLSSVEAMAWAVEMEEKIREWQPNDPNAHWTLILLADIHRLCAFICLYKVLHPKDALKGEKLQRVINEAIKLIYQLPINQPTESVMVFPLFIFGCSSIIQHQRDKIIDRYILVRKYIGFQNIELAIDVIKECWNRWDNSLPGWDWQTVLEEKNWKLLVG